MSQGTVRLEVQAGIAHLILDQPGSRANTLGQAVLAELERALAELQARSDLQGLILRSGKPGMFIAGADLRELGSARPDPEQTRKTVRRGLDVIAGFENLPYPTVAAIEGACMGGGLELAMGLDFRLASLHPKTELGLPETKIGLIPGWGGTQRLPRLIGPALAVEMICAGEAVKPQRAREIGLVWDAVPSERLLDEAIRLLAWARQTGAWKEAREKKRQPAGLSELQHGFIFAVARGQVLAKTRGQYPAPIAALEAVAEGCNLPLEEGLKVETEKFVPLLGSTVTRNLIANFFQDQRLKKDTGVADASIKPADIKLVGVLGAGTMGAGIAGAMIRRGVPTMLLDISQQALERGLSAIGKVLQSRVEIGRMTPQEVMQCLALLSTTTSHQAMADRELVIEAVFENETLKVETFRQVQAVVRPGTILASNTSTISITRMAQAVKEPENFAGLHFFNPVDRMQLVEVIRGEKTSDQTVVNLVALARKIGKTPIVVRDCPGFLVNRILFPYINESLLMLEEGAPPRLLDQVATTFGMPMGPIALNDLVGLDVSLHAGQVINTAFPDRSVPTKILDELVKAGRLGQKSGAGFYSYAKGGRGVDDPALAAILEKCRRGSREFTPEEVQDRLFLPMLTEASRVLEEGIVREPGDVDMGLMLGIGFPAFRGGLLRWADNQGLAQIVQRLQRYEKLGARFQPTEQMRRLAAAGKGFYPSQE